jgi:hypothetical protein
MQLYKLNDADAAVVGKFLRVLCQLDRVDDAKRIAAMSDAQLQLLVQTDALWDMVLRPQITAQAVST